MYYVYLHYTLDTNKIFYVGKGTKRPNKDTFISVYYRAHSLQGRNNFWWKVVNKHGYRIEIHSEYENEKDAFDKEMELISLYGRRNLKKGYLVNVTDGGEGESGRVFTKEHIENLSISMKESFKKRKHPWLGMKHKESSKIKLSESHKGKKHTLETRLKMSEDRKGINNSRFGVGLKGESNPMYGKKHSSEAIEKMKKSAKGRDTSPKIILDINTGVYYYSITDLAITYKLSVSAMYKRLKNKIHENLIIT